MSQPLLASLFDNTERRPVSVSELTGIIRGEMERRFASVWVEGEISNFHAPGSGHWYFTLKDEFAQMRAACYRSSNQRIRFRPEDGLQVRARGRVSVYEPKGEYQLIVEALEPVGAGALQLAFEQTKARLQAEGLFAAELKRPVPMFPRRVGVITSPNGAAIRDILNVISRRTRTVHVLFAPARVQGDGASGEVVRAIKFLNEFHARALRDGRHEEGIDVMIVGRGGGSIEDLWTFNEEVVARAIRTSAIPVISAIGHETDFTIADFVADLRAPTPSAAAEIVVRTREEILDQIAAQRHKLMQLIRYRLAMVWSRLRQQGVDRAHSLLHRAVGRRLQRIDELQYRLRERMRVALESRARAMQSLTARLRYYDPRPRLGRDRSRHEAMRADLLQSMRLQLSRRRGRLESLQAKLSQLSPLTILNRGYAIVTAESGHILMDAEAAPVGSAIGVRLARGRLRAEVTGSET